MSKIFVGQKAQVTRKFTEHDVGEFSELSLDFNPVHLDPDYAKHSMFGQRIVHNSLVASLFFAAMNKLYPNQDLYCLNQELAFLRPVYLDQQVTASIELIELLEDDCVLTLATHCINDEEEDVIKGTATIQLQI
jgi:acyl dehydratase